METLGFGNLGGFGNKYKVQKTSPFLIWWIHCDFINLNPSNEDDYRNTLRWIHDQIDKSHRLIRSNQNLRFRTPIDIQKFIKTQNPINHLICLTVLILNYWSSLSILLGDWLAVANIVTPDCCKICKRENSVARSAILASVIWDTNFDSHSFRFDICSTE